MGASQFGDKRFLGVRSRRSHAMPRPRRLHAISSKYIILMQPSTI
ncbi:hypothetical protein [Microcoleus sp.]